MQPVVRGQIQGVKLFASRASPVISFGLLYAAPPAGIAIADHPGNSKIEIHENKELELECRVRESTPAATIVWYRGNDELKLGQYEYLHSTPYEYSNALRTVIF